MSQVELDVDKQVFDGLQVELQAVHVANTSRLCESNARMILALFDADFFKD